MALSIREQLNKRASEPRDPALKQKILQAISLAKSTPYVKPKRGRPVTLPPHSIVSVRMADNTIAKLDDIAKKSQCTRSDIIRELIEAWYDALET